MKKHSARLATILAISAAVLFASGCTPSTDETPSTGAVSLEVIEIEQVTDLSEDTTPDRG